jgi:hypothetical protein
MKVFEILNAVKHLNRRSKWDKGVKAYAIDLLERVVNLYQADGVKGAATADQFTDYEQLTLRHAMQHNNAEKYKWSDRSPEAKAVVSACSEGAVFLVSNEDIANRLLTKRQKACLRTYCLGTAHQTRALWEALDLIRRIAQGDRY